MTDNNLTNDQRLLAKIALLAQHGTNKPEGEKPSDEELAMLIDNQLDFTRKQQIYSHINATPHLMKQWLELVEIMATETAHVKENLNEAVNESSKTNGQVKHPLLTQLSQWLKSWQGLTATLATSCAVALVVIMQPSLEISPLIATQPHVANSDTLKKKTAPTSQFIGPEKRAISAGILNVVKPNNAKLFSGINLINTIDQQGSSLAPKLYQQYVELGQLLAQQHIKCNIDSGSDSESPILPIQALTEIKDVVNAITEQSFIPLHKSLADMAGIKNKLSAEQLCQRVENFLLLAL
jgi:hypothetical protein